MEILSDKTKYILLSLLGLFFFHPLLIGIVDLTSYMWTGHTLVLSWVDNSVLFVWTFVDVIILALATMI